MTDITDQEFRQFQGFIFEEAGITLSSAKRNLVSGRLARRLQHYRVDSYGHYFALLRSGDAPEEVQIAIDLLTTNETYFFREPRHFELLRARALEAHRLGRGLRVWSAACSSGEEAYSIAMVLADCLGMGAWEVVGTDISTRVLKTAARGHYTMDRGRHIPQEYLKRYCLRGVGEQAGTLLVDRPLRSRVRFVHGNLNQALPDLGQFDVVFLRNVMIYFSDDTKRRVVERVVAPLKSGGELFIGHSESLNGINDTLILREPSVYRKP